MNTHHLKIQSHWFLQVKNGKKTFEIRKNDRGFNAGDIVVLHEVCNIQFATVQTGETLTFKIGYICDFNQKPGYVVFALLPIGGA